MICPICGTNEARTATVEGQVCYQQRECLPCYVILSLDAYVVLKRKAEAWDKRRVLVDRPAKYGYTDKQLEALGLD